MKKIRITLDLSRESIEIIRKLKYVYKGDIERLKEQYEFVEDPLKSLAKGYLSNNGIIKMHKTTDIEDPTNTDIYYWDLTSLGRLISQQKCCK